MIPRNAFGRINPKEEIAEIFKVLPFSWRVQLDQEKILSVLDLQQIVKRLSDEQVYAFEHGAQTSSNKIDLPDLMTAL